MKGCKLQPGHLNTREERRQMRLDVMDLEAQIDRCMDQARRAELLAQLEGIRREQTYDRHVSPRSKRGKDKPGRGRHR